MAVSGPRFWKTAPIVLVAAVATSLFALAPGLRFAYEAPELRVAVETACALVALLASYLAVGRFLRARHLDSLVLAASLGALSCASLIAAVMLAFPPSEDGQIVWSAATAVGAIMLAASAFVPQRPLTRPRNDLLALFAATGVLVAGVAASLALINHVFPPGAVGLARDPQELRSEQHAALFVAETVAMAAFLVAAVGFFRRQRNKPDTFFAFLVVGATLGALAELNYILFASADGGLVRVGDV